MTAQEWIEEAHGEALIECHVNEGRQCAGAAIYRANVCKLPRYSEILVLPPDPELVFTSRQEFLEFHDMNNLKSTLAKLRKSGVK